VHPTVLGVERYPNVLDLFAPELPAYRDYSGIIASGANAGFAGVPFTEGLICNAWSSSDFANTRLANINGAMILSSCDEVKFVACCGLKPTPSSAISAYVAPPRRNSNGYSITPHCS
jgi:hypothetical protein